MPLSNLDIIGKVGASLKFMSAPNMVDPLTLSTVGFGRRLTKKTG